jgi:hypothetical protein
MIDISINETSLTNIANDTKILTKVMISIAEKSAFLQPTGRLVGQSAKVVVSPSLEIT